MHAAVEFQDERIEFDLVTPEVLVDSWHGPQGLEADAARAAVRDALEQPVKFPPVRQMIVPGDRVTIALDADLANPSAIVDEIVAMLETAGVMRSDVTVLATRGSSHDRPRIDVPGVTVEVHDPSDRPNLAYLATTEDGRRIYLNRHLTDADVVIPVGRLGFDPILGYRGPWSLIFPGLSDEATIQAYRLRLKDDAPGRPSPRTDLEESLEVSWLLGAQFYLGLIAGRGGPASVVAGQSEAVRDGGIEAVDRLWSYRPESRAEVVVVGIGEPGVEAGIGDLVEGLVTASRLVQHGGRIVALSRASGGIGPSFRRLIEAGDPKEAPAALRGHDADPDSVLGRRLAQVLAWADVFVLSGLERQVVEDLSMIPLDRPEDARRLVAQAGSCLLVSLSNLTRAVVKSTMD